MISILVTAGPQQRFTYGDDYTQSRDTVEKLLYLPSYISPSNRRPRRGNSVLSRLLYTHS